jgi:hypothetical protein
MSPASQNPQTASRPAPTGGRVTAQLPSLMRKHLPTLNVGPLVGNILLPHKNACSEKKPSNQPRPFHKSVETDGFLQSHAYLRQPPSSYCSRHLRTLFTRRATRDISYQI